MTERQEHDLEPGTILEDRWRVEGLLGRGGFATVYRAAHVKLDRPAAVKVLDVQAPPGEMARFHERFLREAKLSAQIEHPNVVQILDYGVLDLGQRYMQPFIVMEMLRGRDLEEELIEGGPLEPERAWRLFDGALDALRVSHEMGVVHKDLKPSNLFVSRGNGESERLVVVDFGIARAYDDPDAKLTATNQFTGTPAYLAPEYIEQQEISPAIDVYQMGLIIAEALSGTPVVQASSPLSFLMAHCNGQQRIPEHLAGTPLGGVLARAVRVDPADRYPDAAALRAALTEIDWSLVPRAGDAPVATRAQNTNPLPPPGINAFAATAAAMDTPASPHGVPTAIEPAVSSSRSLAPIVVSLGVACALALGGLGYLQRGALFGSPEPPAVTAAAPNALTPPSTSATPPDPEPPAPEPPAAEIAPVAASETPAVEDPADAPEEAAPAPDDSSKPPASDDHAATGRPPAVATAVTSSKPPKKKKVLANERIDLLTPDDADAKLKAAYDAYRVVGAEPALARAAFLKRAETSGLDAPDTTALAFSDVARSYRSAAKALEAAKSAKLKDPALDAAAAALAPVMRDMARLADESYDFRMDRAWTTDPDGLVGLDARWAKLMARFQPRRDAYIQAVYDLERRTLRARFDAADAASSPVVHHWYGLLLNTSLAMAAAEGNASGSSHARYLRLAQGHARALEKLDVHELIGRSLVGSSTRNVITSSARSSRNSGKRIEELAERSRKAAAVLKGADAEHHVVIGWKNLYMAYGVLTRNVYKRTM